MNITKESLEMPTINRPNLVLDSIERSQSDRVNRVYFIAPDYKLGFDLKYNYDTSNFSWELVYNTYISKNPVKQEGKVIGDVIRLGDLSILLYTSTLIEYVEGSDKPSYVPSACIEILDLNRELMVLLADIRIYDCVEGRDFYFEWGEYNGFNEFKLTYDELNAYRENEYNII